MWFTALLCMGGAGAGEERGDDDLRVLPALVERVLLPRMTCTCTPQPRGVTSV